MSYKIEKFGATPITFQKVVKRKKSTFAFINNLRITY